MLDFCKGTALKKEKETRRSAQPTIKDVARMADVSIGTVSGVIHGRSTIREELRIRVQKAIDALGYTPNVGAQSIRMGSTFTIGIVAAHLNAPFITDSIATASAEFHAAGYATLFGTHGDRADREIEVISALFRRRVDALLLSTGSEYDENLHALLDRAETPIILLDRELPSNLDAVMVDHRAAMRRAMEYLIKLGHRRIAVIMGGERIYPTRERSIAYRGALEEAGVPIDPALIGSVAYLPDYGFSQTREMFNLDNPPTAIISGGLAVPGVLRALRELRVRIPDDVSVMSTSRSDLADLMTPALTCESWDSVAIGRAAAQIALERIRKEGDDDTPKRILIQSEFLIRDSCSAVARRRRQI